MTATLSPNPSTKRRRHYETPDYAKFVSRALRAYGKRVADADEIDLADMVQIYTEFQVHIAEAIKAQRAMGRSWEYIAAGLGETRQAARAYWQPRIDALE